MNNKLVSILIPVYNREDLIEETVKSALSQTYKNIELIIVDNKSTDTTWEVLNRLSNENNRIKIFQNKTNIGPVRNWKRCIDEANGDYGKILWSDDLISPEFIEKTLPFLENNDVGFVFTGTEIFIDGTDKKNKHAFIGESGIYDSDKYINGILFGGGYPVSPGCAIFRLEDLKKNLLIDIPNKVNSDFSMHAIGNDLLIFLLTAHKYKNFVFLNEKLSFFRAHEGSISIQSNDGKLPLHYDLVTAYFIENFRIDLVTNMNSKLWITLKRHGNSTNKFRFNNISSFYLKNKNYSLNYKYFRNKILQKILTKLGLNK